MSCMSGSSNLDSFRDVVVGGCTAAVLKGVSSRTCPIWDVAFLCNCRQAFSPNVFVSIHVVHLYISIDTTAA